MVRHCPPLSLPPLCLPSVHLMSLHKTRSPRPSLSSFTYCKQSKTGAEEGLGTRLSPAGIIQGYLLSTRALHHCFCYCRSQRLWWPEPLEIRNGFPVFVPVRPAVVKLTITSVLVLSKLCTLHSALCTLHSVMCNWSIPVCLLVCMHCWHLFVWMQKHDKRGEEGRATT